jgi:hypothetical protein
VSAYDCGTPGIKPFVDANGNSSDVKEFPGQLVTGVQIDPRSGTLFTQASTGGEAPVAEKVQGFGHGQTLLGWKLPN